MGHRGRPVIIKRSRLDGTRQERLSVSQRTLEMVRYAARGNRQGDLNESGS